MSFPAFEDAERHVDWDAARRLIRDRLIQLSRPEDRVDLDDLIQESCIRLLRAVSNAKSRNLGGLATVVARRTWIDYLRRKTRARRLLIMTDSTEIERLPPAGLTVAPLADPNLGDLRERIELIVLEIFDERSAERCLELAQAYFDERDWFAVAQELGAEYAAVRKRWSRCVATLRSVMSRDPDFAELFAHSRVSPTGESET